MKLRKWLIDYIPMVLTAILILYYAIQNDQPMIKTLPTLITLVVQLLIVAANRYGFLLGGLNSALYGIAYFTEGLYFSMISALVISFPFQILSFFHWSKHSDQKSKQTRLQFLTWRSRAMILMAVLAAWGICSFLLAPHFAKASYPALDSFVFVVGIAVTALSAFRFIDSQYINILSTAIQIVMWVLIAIRSPENLNYVIISVYNCFRVIEAAIRWTLQYRNQTKKKETLSA